MVASLAPSRRRGAPLSQPLFVFAGPCVIESADLCLRIADHLAGIAERQPGVRMVFKASYDKANRTSADAFRGPGIDEGLRILQDVRARTGLPVLTDVHCPAEARQAGEVVDFVQIPAFLCRQTDLLLAAAGTRAAVHVKKGQFMAPSQMGGVVQKLRSGGAREIWLTERGAAFGYNDLVVDMRSLVWMRQLGVKVVFDATHSVQRPGAGGDHTGGDRSMAPHLARAAVAVGVDGLFAECHPEPQAALSDGPNMLRLDDVEPLIEGLVRLRGAL
jgi:2-dehydro-3-deoxyphosphooctonate aldolase (KDO 8-P synthase)